MSWPLSSERWKASRTQWRSLLGILVVMDLISFLVASAGARWLASQPLLGNPSTQDYRTFVPLLLVVFIALSLTQGLYDSRNLLGGTREYAAIFRTCAYGLVATILIGFTVRRHVSREWLSLSWTLAAALVGIERFSVRRIAYRLRRRGYFTTRAVVVGADADSVTVARQLGQPGSGIQVVGFLDDYLPSGTLITGRLRVLGHPASLLEISASANVQEAIVVPQALSWETLQSLMTEAAVAPTGLRVHLSAGFYDLLTAGVRLEERNHVPLLTLNKLRLTTFETAFKTTLDYTLASLLLVGLAPVAVTAALRLRLHGDGGILERRRVLGRHGKPFDQLSFRSAGPVHSVFIRKLPGLLNVLAGQLSLVGPRPVGEHEPGLPGGPRARVLSLRPGLTGPWRQVDAIEEQAVLDLYYIRSYSIWLDLQVLFLRALSRLRRPSTGQTDPTDLAAERHSESIALPGRR